MQTEERAVGLEVFEVLQERPEPAERPDFLIVGDDRQRRLLRTT